MNRYILSKHGFSLIELLVAMSVFSFMLLIIVSGFLNIVRMHNQAIASNIAQDSARTVMDEVVRAVRDSTEVVTPAPASTSNTLCLANSSGPQIVYYVSPTLRLLRAEGCGAKANPQELTSPSVKVTNFEATVETSGTNILKPEVKLTVTVASINGTNPATNGAAIACGPTTADRSFCSTITLTSGAVPR